MVLIGYYCESKTDGWDPRKSPQTHGKIAYTSEKGPRTRGKRWCTHRLNLRSQVRIATRYHLGKESIYLVFTKISIYLVPPSSQ